LTWCPPPVIIGLAASCRWEPSTGCGLRLMISCEHAAQPISPKVDGETRATDRGGRASSVSRIAPVRVEWIRRRLGQKLAGADHVVQ
jgi:hypothetical protein